MRNINTWCNLLIFAVFWVHPLIAAPDPDTTMLGNKPAEITKRSKEVTTVDGKQTTTKVVETIEPTTKQSLEAYPKDITVGKGEDQFKFNVKNISEEKEITKHKDEDMVAITDRIRIQRNYIACSSIGICLGSLQLSSYAFLDINYRKGDNDLLVTNPIAFDLNFVNVDWIFGKSGNFGIGIAAGTGVTGGVNFFGVKEGVFFQTDFVRLELGHMSVGPTSNSDTSFNNGIYFGVGAPLLRYASEVKDALSKK